VSFPGPQGTAITRNKPGKLKFPPKPGVVAGSLLSSGSWTQGYRQDQKRGVTATRLRSCHDLVWLLSGPTCLPPSLSGLFLGFSGATETIQAIIELDFDFLFAHNVRASSRASLPLAIGGVRGGSGHAVLQHVWMFFRMSTLVGYAPCRPY
jgi:hypothetical protein